MNNKQTLCTLYLATALMTCSFANASEAPQSMHKNILARFDNILLLRLDTLLAKLNEKKPLPWITRLDRLLIGLGKTGLKAVGTVLCHPVASTAIFVTVCAAIPPVRRTVFPRLGSAIKSGFTNCYTRFATNYPDNPLVRAVNFFKPDREHERAQREQTLRDTQAATQQLTESVAHLSRENADLRENFSRAQATLVRINQVETGLHELGQRLHAIHDQTQQLSTQATAIPGLQITAAEHSQRLQVAQQDLGTIQEILQNLDLHLRPSNQIAPQNREVSQETRQTLTPQPCSTNIETTPGSPKNHLNLVDVL